MKKLLVSFFLFTWVSLLSAQTEPVIPQDNLNIPTSNVKSFGDFMIDMSLFEPIRLPEFDFENIYGNQNFIVNFTPDSKVTYSVGMIPNSFGYSNFYGTQTVRTASFEISDNIRLNTYGHYNSEGYKVRNPAVHPWNKNDFMGGMEMKFNNGFGIRMELRRQTTPFYP